MLQTVQKWGLELVVVGEVVFLDGYLLLSKCRIETDPKHSSKRLTDDHHHHQLFEPLQFQILQISPYYETVKIM